MYVQCVYYMLVLYLMLYAYNHNPSTTLTLTLPGTPSVNDQIDIFDASGNASTYNITVARNGKLINGNAGNLIIDVKLQTVLWHKIAEPYLKL